MHLVGFIIRIYRDARSPERQIHKYISSLVLFSQTARRKIPEGIFMFVCVITSNPTNAMLLHACSFTNYLFLCVRSVLHIIQSASPIRMFDQATVFFFFVNFYTLATRTRLLHCASFFRRFFSVRANRALISPIRVLTSVHHTINSQLFLQPKPLPRREHAQLFLQP